MLQAAFGASCMNRAPVFEWHKSFKEGRESVGDDERCGSRKEVRKPELIGQRFRVRVRKTFGRKRSALFESGQRNFHQDNAPVHNSILVTDYLAKIGTKIVPHRPYIPDLAPLVIP